MHSTQDSFLKTLNSTLTNCINELDTIHELFVQHLGCDFSRTRKISFANTFWFLNGLQGKFMPNDILDFLITPSLLPRPPPLFNSKKGLTGAWEFLFLSFNYACTLVADSSMFGYHIFAVDVSNANIYHDTDDKETFIHEEEKRDYNAIHINILYELLNHTYHDVVFQGKKKLHESSFFNSMINLYQGFDASFIAKQGYKSFNTFAHVVENRQKFLIRMKDINSNSILSVYYLPDNEFNTYISTTLNRRHTKNIEPP